MEGMNQIALPGQKGLKYLDYRALYLALRAKGGSHQQALFEMRAKNPRL
jgi:hypothetical protein